MGLISTPLCRRLLTHWQSLANECGGPDFRTWQDSLNLELQPWLFVIDAHENLEVHVRLMGTFVSEAWGEDLSGVELRSTYGPERIDHIYEAYKALPDVPCGLVEQTILKSAKGHIKSCESLWLPFKTGVGSPKKIVTTGEYTGYNFDIQDPDGSLAMGIVSVKNRNWVDLGWGVHDRDPSCDVPEAGKPERL